VQNKELIDKLEIIRNMLKPVLSYIPRGLDNYTDHGTSHSERIEKLIDRLAEALKDGSPATLNEMEEFLLRLTAWVHDLGCIISRKRHAERSGRILETHFSDIPYITEYIPIIALIAKAHSDDGGDKNRILDLSDRPISIQGEHVRLRYIGAVFRLLDACDISSERTPGLVRKILIEEMSDENKKYWDAHKQVIGITIDPLGGDIEVSVRDKEQAHPVIEDLKQNIFSVSEVLEKNGWTRLSLKVISAELSPDENPDHS